MAKLPVCQAVMIINLIAEMMYKGRVPQGQLWWLNFISLPTYDDKTFIFTLVLS